MSSCQPNRRVVRFAIVALFLPAACGEIDDLDPGEVMASSGTAQTSLGEACAWDPVFGVQGSYQSNWWLEFSVRDASTIGLLVEVGGVSSSRLIILPNRIVLAGGYVKFTGGVGSAPVANGTIVRLQATQSAAAGGKTASSAWFAYRAATPVVDCAECTPTCAPDTCGSDGCNSTCACATGAVCLSDLTCCYPNAFPCGPDGCGGSHGACGCVPDCATRQCGDDGCDGSCGSCGAGTTCVDGACASGCVSPWSPFWQQTASAGSWWVEFQVAGGGSIARSVSFEVVGGSSKVLTFSYGRWTGGVSGVASGTTVMLHATDATGATAQTLPFRYLVDRVPVTDPCRGTASTSACRPLGRGMVTLAMDDSYESQALLARPVLARYGFKATIYSITRQLEVYGQLHSAQALAADGNEVGSHSRTHPNLTTLTPQALDDELLLSRQYLLANVGSPVESFASPMGAYNDAVIAAIKLHYSSNRTVSAGLNYMGSDVYRLNANGVFNASAVSAVCAQLAQAATYKGWLILVFHNFTSAATTSSSLTYPIASFDAILACAQSTPGLDVVTIRQGVSRIECGTP